MLGEKGSGPGLLAYLSQLPTAWGTRVRIYGRNWKINELLSILSIPRDH